MGNRTAEAMPRRVVSLTRPGPARPVHGLPDIPQMGDMYPFRIRSLFGYVPTKYLFFSVKNWRFRWGECSRPTLSTFPGRWMASGSI